MTAPAKPSRTERKARRPIARKSRPRKLRKTSVAALKRKLWALVARYVRDRDGDVCVTCGEPANQAGHFYSRSVSSTWVDPKNLGAQCPTCNLYLHGNPGAFAEYVANTYGQAELVRLTERARVIKHWRQDELEALIEAIRISPSTFECAYYEENL